MFVVFCFYIVKDKYDGAILLNIILSLWKTCEKFATPGTLGSTDRPLSPLSPYPAKSNTLVRDGSPWPLKRRLECWRCSGFVGQGLGPKIQPKFKPHL